MDNICTKLGDASMSEEELNQDLADFENLQSKIKKQIEQHKNEINNLEQTLEIEKQKIKAKRDKFIRKHFTNDHFFFEHLLDGQNYDFAKKIIESIDKKSCLCCEHRKQTYVSLGEECVEWCELYKSTDPPDAINCEFFEQNSFLIRELGYKG